MSELGNILPFNGTSQSSSLKISTFPYSPYSIATLLPQDTHLLRWHQGKGDISVEK